MGTNSGTILSLELEGKLVGGRAYRFGDILWTFNRGAKWGPILRWEETWGYGNLSNPFGKGTRELGGSHPPRGWAPPKDGVFISHRGGAEASGEKTPPTPRGGTPAERKNNTPKKNTGGEKL